MPKKKQQERATHTKREKHTYKEHTVIHTYTYREKRTRNKRERSAHNSTYTMIHTYTYTQ